MTGIAPEGVRRVRAELDKFSAEADVEAVTGAFIIGIRVPIPEFPPKEEILHAVR
jgi:hypothetical protein